MGGAYNRKKGHDFEREVAQKLRSVFPNAKRHLEMQIEEAKGFDLDHTGALKIQCKRLARYASPTVLKEVICSQKEIPVLVTQANREQAVVVLYFDDFVKILEDIGIVFEGEK